MICEAGQKIKKYEMYKEERKMKCNIRRVVLMLMLFVGTTLSAQNISVASFKLLENDLTANTTGTMERDQNGEAAALIKVVTTQQGFVFDGGMVGIVKTKQGVGEVWVYVPHGIKKITIQHPQLGVLRDYYFPIAVEKARTYEMVLTTGRVETVVTHSVNKQFVVFNVTPTDAIVELNDEILSVDSEGNATKGVAYGTYNYRVSCANYHTEAGQVTVTAEGKAEVNVTLRPNFGWIKLDGDTDLRGAHVYIDNVRVGQLPFVSEKIKSGNHRVKIVKNMYKPYEQQVVVKDNETSELNVEMIPNFAVVTLTTDAESEIWIDGERRGKGRWNGRLELGDYTIEVKKESHRTASEILHVNTIEARTIQLKSPTPIYASLEVSSTPLRATVYIDDVEVGETPLIKSDVLVGTRRITLKKEGYNVANRTLLVMENEENKVSAELSKVQSVAPASKPTAKPTQPMTTKPQSTVKKPQPTSKPKSTKKSVEWGGLVGIDAGYSTYGLNYGGEVGVMLNNWSLSVGVEGHMMGEYTMLDAMTGEYESTHSIHLLCFATKLGYTFGMGNFRMTPQVGVVYGPSFFLGKQYIKGEFPDDSVLDNTDYIAMNRNILQFAKMRCGFVIGSRFEYKFGNSGFGLHVTPEYIIGEGVSVNAGLSMNF